MLEIPIHEFYLPDGEIYRVALGNLILTSRRKTFTPPEYSSAYYNQTGSVGFMDVIVGEGFAPKVNAETLPYTAHSAGLYAGEDYEPVTALIIQDIAIEPAYRRQGYATYLKQRAEQLAREWGLEAVISPFLLSPIMRQISRKLGYTLYSHGVRGIKRLNLIP